MFHYQIALMEYLALWKNFADAVKEGDGERIIRCWKFIFPYLFNDGIHSKKYNLEAFYLVLQLNCLLSEKDAYSLMWNRTCRSKNGKGIYFIFTYLVGAKHDILSSSHCKQSSQIFSILHEIFKWPQNDDLEKRNIERELISFRALELLF